MSKLLSAALVLIGMQVSAQSIFISTGSKISFFAGTPVEDINAVNVKAISFLNIKTGEVTISIPNKEFHFKRSLMEEHFNENYMESEKFPKSEFKGTINDIQHIDLKSKTSLTTTVTGVLTIHGVSKARTFNATIHNDENKITGEVKFSILLTDHNIERPKILWEKIAENVEVTANFIYEPYKK